MAVEKDQKKFFDEYAARHERKEPVNAFFFELATNELRRGFRWLAGCDSVLEYGCGTGETISLFLATAKYKPSRIVGIDLSEVSIKVAMSRYPYEFRVVPDNDLSFLAPASLEGAYMIGVLHHTESHEKIFAEIARVLEPGGKFLILDLTRNNPFIELARAAFPYMPKRVKQMFPDDLVVDENIPEKLKVEAGPTLELLEKSGFSVEQVEYGHLFYFLFDWLERLTRIEISKTRFKAIYSWFYRIEKKMLSFALFQRRAGSFVVHAVRSR